MAEPPVTIETMLKRRWALVTDCENCERHVILSTVEIARIVGWKGIGATREDLIRRLKCAQCGSVKIKAYVRGDPLGFVCKGYLSEADKHAEFVKWLCGILGSSTPTRPCTTKR